MTQLPVPTARARFKASREQQLLGLAQQILQQEGFAGLSMDRLTALSDVSKGTVYNHFCSKEDLFSALSIRSLQQQLVVLQQALTLQGHSRERMLALHCAYYHYARTEPTLFLCLLTATMPVVLEKTSAARLAQRQQLEQQLAGICAEVMQEAVAAGALSLPAASAVDGWSFLHWAYALGSNLLFEPSRQIGLFSELQPEQQLQSGLHILLDGMQWQPLSQHWDYQRSWQRISQQLQATLIAPSCAVNTESEQKE